MNKGKLITELMEATEIPDDSAYLIRMGDGTGTKQVKHSTLSKEVVGKAEVPDLSGVLGEKGENANFQQLIDAIADRVMTKLVEKSCIVNNSLTTEEGFILDARVAKVHQDEIDEINSNLPHNPVPDLFTAGAKGLTLCRWDGHTANTPYTAGLMTNSMGWAICNLAVKEKAFGTVIAGGCGSQTVYVASSAGGAIRDWKLLVQPQ